MGTILRPTWISIWICGWRQDRLVDPIEIGCTNSLTLWLIKNLWAARSVSIFGSSQLVSSTQCLEFAALQQHTAHLTEKYEQPSADYEQLYQMVMDMRSQMGGTCTPLFWSYGFENDQPPPPSIAPPLF